jgi:hypothetical protein
MRLLKVSMIQFDATKIEFLFKNSEIAAKKWSGFPPLHR